MSNVGHFWKCTPGVLPLDSGHPLSDFPIRQSMFHICLYSGMHFVGTSNALLGEDVRQRPPLAYWGGGGAIPRPFGSENNLMWKNCGNISTILSMCTWDVGLTPFSFLNTPLSGLGTENTFDSNNKKLSYCWETVRRESMPRIAETDVEMTT